MISQVFGFLLAMYFLVGRWSIERLDSALDDGPVYQQPRVWIVAALVVWVLLAISGRAGKREGRSSMSLDAAICLFLGYMLLASLWSPDSELALAKAIEVSLLLAVAISMALSRLVLRHEEILDGFWWAIVLVCGAMAGLAVLNATGGRIYVPGGGPNTFGRNMGLMALGAAYLASRYGKKVVPISAAVMIVAVLLILMSGSRGALLSATVGISILLISARASLSTKLTAAGVVTAAVALLLFNTVTGSDALDVFQSRIVETTVYNRNLSARDDLWQDAFDWAKERPWFGWGLNGYRANSWTYPHNMFLEITVEGGCVGVLLLLNVGREWLSQLRRSRIHIPRVPVAALALAFTAAQTSGDLFDSRGVFLMLALSAPPILLSQRSTYGPHVRLGRLPGRLVPIGTTVPKPTRR